MDQKLVSSLENLGFNKADICEKDQVITLERTVGGVVFSCKIQNLLAPEIDITYGPVAVYRSFGSVGELIDRLNILAKDLEYIGSKKEDIKFIKKRLFILSVGWRVAGLEKPTILGL